MKIQFNADYHILGRETRVIQFEAMAKSTLGRPAEPVTTLAITCRQPRR